jgi:hypothetical protein
MVQPRIDDGLSRCVAFDRNRLTAFFGKNAPMQAAEVTDRQVFGT